jgi:hypothetical protein
MFSEILLEIKSKIQEINDDELFELLDCASEELKRRNGLLMPSIPDIRNKSPQANLQMVIEALAGMGVKANTTEKTKP